MTYRELLYVVTIYNEGSFSAAARKLYVSQSALSQAIHKLERELGCTLFAHSGIRSEPTKDCRFFVSQSRQVISAWEQFESELKIYLESQQAELTVGMPPMLLNNLAPYVLPLFEEAHPNVTVKVIEERSNTLERLAAQDIIDLCVVQEPLMTAAVEAVPIFATEFLLAVPQSHPFCKAHPFRGLHEMEFVSLGELREAPFALIRNDRVERMQERIFEAAGFTPKIYRRSSVMNNIKEYIKYGKCVGLVEEILVNHDPDDDRIAYYHIADGPSARNTVVAYRPGKRLNKKELWFIEAMRKYPRLTGGAR